MSSKYGESLGIWELKVGRSEEMGALNLHPTHLDNKELLKIVTDERLKTNQLLMMEKVGAIIKKIIERDYPPANDDEKKELDEYIDLNLINLVQELFVVFKYMSRSDIEAQKIALKKGMLQEAPKSLETN